GHPLQQVQITLNSGPQTESSGPDGLADFTLPQDSFDHAMLIAKNGEDVAFLPEYTSSYSGRQSHWVQREATPHLLWYVFDDRGIYQPGETVHIKGWARNARIRRAQSLQIPGVKKVRWTVTGPRNNTLKKGTTT